MEKERSRRTSFLFCVALVSAILSVFIVSIDRVLGLILFNVSWMFILYVLMVLWE